MRCSAALLEIVNWIIPVHREGEAGMDIPRGIICRAAGLLKEGGLLVLEHSASQAALMREAARETGFIEVFTKKDLAGAPHALVATRERISQ